MGLKWVDEMHWFYNNDEFSLFRLSLFFSVCFFVVVIISLCTVDDIRKFKLSASLWWLQFYHWSYRVSLMEMCASSFSLDRWPVALFLIVAILLRRPAVLAAQFVRLLVVAIVVPTRRKRITIIIHE